MFLIRVACTVPLWSVSATLLNSTLVYQQQNDEADREELHNYAWAALQLLIEEGCVELVRSPPPLADKRVTATSTATATATAANVPGGGGNPRGKVAAAAIHGQAYLPAPPLRSAKRQKGYVAQQQGAQTLLVTNGRTAVAAAAVSCGGRGGGVQESGSVGGGGVGGETPEEDGRVLIPTKLGMAIFRSSMPPGDGLTVYRDLSGRVGIGWGCK